MKRLFRHEKLRFVTVGVLNTTLDFVLFNFFVLVIHLPAVVGNIFSVSLCIVISYFLNHHFVFQRSDNVQIAKFAQFVLVTGTSSIGIQSLILWLFGLLTKSDFGHSIVVIDKLSNSHALELNVAKAAAVAIGMVWNFLLYKYVVFRKTHEAIQPEEIIV